MIVAKIETSDATKDLDAIVNAADGVMVARGDLGVRLPMEDVPHIQKQIIRTAVRYGRPVITATQMLESMVTASTPTRAEVTDVANAVLDGSSALMLSGETAIGVDPVGVVATMARITMRAEREFDFLGWGSRLGVQTVADGATSPAGITAAISAAGWRAAVDEAADVIIACTLTGRTARSISRFRPNMQLVATTPSPRTARQLTLSWGVETLLVPLSSSTDVIVDRAVRAAVQAGYVEPGDIAVVLAGSPGVPEPTSDTLRLVLVD
jgi:pyruvate kinase